jgi:hypothetical protein
MQGLGSALIRTSLALTIGACASSTPIVPTSARLDSYHWRSFSGNFVATGPDSRFCLSVNDAYNLGLPDSSEAELSNGLSGKRVTVWARLRRGSNDYVTPDVQFAEEMGTHRKTLCFRRYHEPKGTVFKAIDLRASDTLTVSNPTWWSGSPTVTP